MDQPAARRRRGRALAIGCLGGTERHWRERGEPAGARTAGIRTYALSGLTGGLSGTLGESMPEAGRALVPALSLAVFAAVFAVFKWREMVAQGDFSVTGVIAALATFLLGILAVLGDPAVAAAGAIALVAVLASRDALHDFVRALRWEELRSALLLLAMTFVILPLLPQKGIGPGELLDLRRIWVLAIVLAGVSFLGYIAVRSLGPGRGPVVAGLAGGRVSSTAVAVTSARETREGASAPVAAAGALAASAVSVARTLVLAVALLGTMPARALAFVAIALVFAGGAVVLAWRSGVLAGTAPQERPGGEGASAKPAGAQYANPFDIGTVLQFAALLGAAAIAGPGASAVAPSTTMRRPPSVIWSPARSAPRLTFLPLTKVPSALPMSMMEMAPSGETSITEWMRETFSSSSTRCADARRPILMISRLNCSLRTSSLPRNTLRVMGVAMVSRVVGWVPATGRRMPASPCRASPRGS
jgi:uncharacterized membrane protein (DUF4010 family)